MGVLMKTQYSEGKDKDLIDLIDRMAYMAEFHEPDAVFHRKRVKDYCFILARGLGFSIHDAETLAFASLLHDVGKISIPETITSKAEDLTPEEWEYVRRHPNVGADIIKGSTNSLMQIAEVIALTHHERWDGSGYPQGLKGEDIPLGGRIFAVADVFDALTTKRAYKPEISVQNAIDLVIQSSGTLFDPKVIDVFQKNSDEIIRIRKQNLV